MLEHSDIRYLIGSGELLIKVLSSEVVQLLTAAAVQAKVPVLQQDGSQGVDPGEETG